jgi:site-specific recombinase XerC
MHNSKARIQVKQNCTVPKGAPLVLMAEDQNMLDDYLQHLLIERGLSENTLTAYHADILRFLDFKSKQGLTFAEK